jgi:hypothetical protein
MDWLVNSSTWATVALISTGTYNIGCIYFDYICFDATAWTCARVAEQWSVSGTNDFV